jgi:hypothetical protein
MVQAWGGFGPHAISSPWHEVIPQGVWPGVWAGPVVGGSVGRGVDFPLPGNTEVQPAAKRTAISTRMPVPYMKSLVFIEITSAVISAQALFMGLFYCKNFGSYCIVLRDRTTVPDHFCRPLSRIAGRGPEFSHAINTWSESMGIYHDKKPW